MKTRHPAARVFGLSARDVCMSACCVTRLEVLYAPENTYMTASRAGYPRSRELPRAIVSEPSSPIEDLETFARKRLFDKTSGGTTLRNQSLAIPNHQEWMATQLGPAPGGSHVHDRRPLPRLSGPAILQPSMNLLEDHCWQCQCFHSILAASRATIDFLLDNRGVAFPSVSQEHRARCDLGRAAGCTRHPSRIPAASNERWDGRPNVSF
ncbi:hypothetical protein MRX96_047122 [Rhipicephalus microplus]